MDPETKRRWVAALRSGDYRQGFRRLRDGDAYCCLGVLCDIVDPSGWLETTPGCWRYQDGPWKPAALPPQALMDRIGLARGFAANLSVVNDNRGSFNRIADLIEAKA